MPAVPLIETVFDGVDRFFCRVKKPEILQCGTQFAVFDRVLNGGLVGLAVFSFGFATANCFPPKSISLFAILVQHTVLGAYWCRQFLLAHHLSDVDFNRSGQTHYGRVRRSVAEWILQMRRNFVNH